MPADNHMRGAAVFERKSDSSLLVHLRGKWQLGHDMPSSSVIAKELSAQAVPVRLGYEASELTGWDSALISFLVETDDLCRTHGVESDRSGLPEGIRRLVELAEAVPERQGARAVSKRVPFFAHIGDLTVGYLS